MKNQKGFTVVEGLFVVIALTLISFAGWYVWDRQANIDSKNSQSNTSKTQETAKEADFTSLTEAYILSNCTGSTEASIKNTLSDTSRYKHDDSHGIVEFDCKLGEYDMNVLYLKKENTKITNVLPKPVGGPSCEFLNKQGFPRSVYDGRCADGNEAPPQAGDSGQYGGDGQSDGSAGDIYGVPPACDTQYC